MSRAAFVAEAYTWVGTPWHHMACVKGRGVDCAMLLVGCARVAGLIPADYVPAPYTCDWYLHRDEERFLAEVKKFADPLASSDQVEPGDVLVAKIGRCFAHGAIFVAPGLIVHSDRKAKKVKLAEASIYDHLERTYWRVRGG